MFSNPVENLIEPTWRRFARCVVSTVVGVGMVVLLVAATTFLPPLLP